MRKFAHGDHDCSVICMDIEEALVGGLLLSHEGDRVSFSSPGRAAYAFCSACGHYAWSASESMSSGPAIVIEGEDEKLEGMAVRGFMSAANESCEVQRNTELIREVMTS